MSSAVHAAGQVDVEGLDIEVEGGVKEIRSVFDNLSYKGKFKMLVGSLLLLFVLFIIAIVQGSAAQKAYGDTYIPVSSMPSDYDDRCQLTQGATFAFIDLFKASWMAPPTVTSSLSATPPSSSVTLVDRDSTDALSGAQVYLLSFNREYTNFADVNNPQLISGDETPNSVLAQHTSTATTVHGASLGAFAKDHLEETSITFKQKTDTSKTPTEYSYEVFAGTSVTDSTALLGVVQAEDYGADATLCTTFDLETITVLDTTGDSLRIMTSANTMIDTLTLASDGSKIWELAGGIECKPSSGQKFTSGFQITMAWLVFIVSAQKAYWLTSKWSLLMKNKDYFRAKGAAFAEQLIHELV